MAHRLYGSHLQERIKNEKDLYNDYKYGKYTPRNTYKYFYELHKDKSQQMKKRYEEQNNQKQNYERYNKHKPKGIQRKQGRKPLLENYSYLRIDRRISRIAELKIINICLEILKSQYKSQIQLDIVYKMRDLLYQLMKIQNMRQSQLKSSLTPKKIGQSQLIENMENNSSIKLPYNPNNSNVKILDKEKYKITQSIIKQKEQNQQQSVNIKISSAFHFENQSKINIEGQKKLHQSDNQKEEIKQSSNNLVSSAQLNLLAISQLQFSQIKNYQFGSIVAVDDDEIIINKI